MKVSYQERRVIVDTLEKEVNYCYECPYFRSQCENSYDFDDDCDCRYYCGKSGNTLRVFFTGPLNSEESIKEKFNEVPRHCPFLQK